MKFLFLTGSRSEWGYIKPLLENCKKNKIKFTICATNMHLLATHGMAINEIKKEGYKVDHEIYMSLEGGNYYTMAKSMGVFQISFVDVILKEKPDWIILAGDRNETLIGAICGAYTYTPVAHIQAGELSGNIDGMARHAIGKFAHLHFASNTDAVKRLKKLGENNFRIKNVGAPQLDGLKEISSKNIKKIKKHYNIMSNDKFCLVVFHPLTEEFKLVSKQTKILINTLNKIKLKKFWIMPNNDAGYEYVKNVLLDCRKSDTQLIRNMSREDYLTLLKYSEFIIGNSSSGIIEAPTFAIPAINLGNRQKNRFRGKNVIDLENFEEKLILNKIKIATSKSFKEKIKKAKNPYGNGNSSEKIIKILKETKITKSLISKHLTY